MLPSEYPDPAIVLQQSSTTHPSVLLKQPLSSEDKYVLYAVLHDIANELRRIRREQKKHHTQEGN